MVGKGFDVSDKVAFLYFIHFKDKDPDLVTCNDCIDYKLGFCSGGFKSIKSILDCMYDKAKNCEFMESI